MVKLHGFDIQFFLLLLICLLAEKVRYVLSPYGSDAQIALLISKVFQILPLDYSVHVTLFLCKHYIEEKNCLMLYTVYSRQPKLQSWTKWMKN